MIWIARRFARSVMVFAAMAGWLAVIGVLLALEAVSPETAQTSVLGALAASVFIVALPVGRKRAPRRG